MEYDLGTLQPLSYSNCLNDTLFMSLFDPIVKGFAGTRVAILFSIKHGLCRIVYFVYWAT
jgi:hypothetical protein